MYKLAYVNIHTHINIFIYMYICTNMCVYVSIFICMNIYMYIYTHTYIYVYMHIHTCIYVNHINTHMHDAHVSTMHTQRLISYSPPDVPTSYRIRLVCSSRICLQQCSHHLWPGLVWSGCVMQWELAMLHKGRQRTTSAHKTRVGTLSLPVVLVMHDTTCMCVEAKCPIHVCMYTFICVCIFTYVKYVYIYARMRSVLWGV